MKSRIQQIVFLGTLMILCSCVNALAQDAGMSDVEVTAAPADVDKANFTPGEELRYVPRATSANSAGDSIALQIHDFPMQRAAQRPTEKSGDKPAAKKDDSILTFNFLYYIIQKYKLQDIID